MEITQLEEAAVELYKAYQACSEEDTKASIASVLDKIGAFLDSAQNDQKAHEEYLQIKRMWDEEREERVHQRMLDKAIERACSTDCMRYRQGTCTFRQKEHCPRVKALRKVIQRGP